MDGFIESEESEWNEKTETRHNGRAGRGERR